MLRLRDIQRRFDRAAAGFADADFVHAATREGLASRLAPMVLSARTILDLGSAAGATGRLLRQRFRRAHIISLDVSAAMLVQGRQQKGRFARASFVQGDAMQLPFADQSFDLVVSNQLLPWIPEPQAVFEQVSRVLKKGGLFAFASLGPDSLQALRHAWATVDDGAHVNPFPDMHDIGDSLVRAGLSDPVLDVDRLEVRYENVGKLFDDLTRIGARNALAARSPGLTGTQRFRAMAAALENATPGPGLSLELELVYGHCWGGAARNAPGSVRIDANNIPLRR
jgi:malonyl-CoA O-methyltransferase